MTGLHRSNSDVSGLGHSCEDQRREGSSPVRGGGCKDEGASDLGLLGARTITCVGSATFDNVFHIFCFFNAHKTQGVRSRYCCYLNFIDEGNETGEAW